MRDDFNKTIKEALAKRVAMHCSNPDCGRVTSGPQADSEKATNIGVAAHISAASPGGARYDMTMTPSERASIRNGIWLCQSCAKLIDDNPLKFTIALLQGWKEVAESHAEAALELRSTKEQGEADVSLIRFYSQCFDRPAFQDEFEHEGSMEDFSKAIATTITAINTGTLISRDGVVLAQAKGKSFLVNAKWREKMDVIVDLLRAILSRYKTAIDEKEIRIHDREDGRQFYVICQPGVAAWIDRTRAEIIRLFSGVCIEANLPALRFPRRTYWRYFEDIMYFKE